jgi:uncharacterized membrane protein
MKKIGFVLIAVGTVMMIYTGFNYVTTENVVDIGPISIDAKKNNPVQWSPILGAALLVGGILLIVFNKKSVT